MRAPMLTTDFTSTEPSAFIATIRKLPGRAFQVSACRPGLVAIADQ